MDLPFCCSFTELTVYRQTMSSTCLRPSLKGTECRMFGSVGERWRSWTFKRWSLASLPRERVYQADDVNLPRVVPFSSGFRSLWHIIQPIALRKSWIETEPGYDVNKFRFIQKSSCSVPARESITPVIIEEAPLFCLRGVGAICLGLIRSRSNVCA